MRFHLIQSAADKAGVSVDTIRSYCRQGLLRPERDSAGRRLFTEADITRIREIYLDNMARRPSLAGDRK
jgi:DNA-binding transcriptional MerR regulator